VATTLVCLSYLHTGLRVRRAPGLPCTLDIEGDARPLVLERSYVRSGHDRVAAMRKCVFRHCEEQGDEAIQTVVVPVLAWRGRVKIQIRVRRGLVDRNIALRCLKI
jgi:hypothetical protein